MSTTIGQWIDNVMGGFSKDELHAAFSLVEDKTDWKLPIDKTIDAEQLEVVARAIEFYTGSTCTITPIMGTDRIRVQAPGYYMVADA
jgi:hypothetical protein